MSNQQPSFEDDIGGSAAWQVKRTIKRAGGQLLAPTRRLLQQAVPTLETAVELLCPAILEPTSQGLRTYYGPMPGLDDGQLFFFVNNGGQYVAGTQAWPSDDAIAQYEASIRADGVDYNRADVWGVLYDLIAAVKTEADTPPIMKAWLLLIGVSGKAQFVQEAQKLKAVGFLPAIWVIAVKDKNQQRKGGMTGMLALPPAYVPYEAA
jgi:hypothetical protein